MKDSQQAAELGIEYRRTSKSLLQATSQPANEENLSKTQENHVEEAKRLREEVEERLTKEEKELTQRQKSLEEDNKKLRLSDHISKAQNYILESLSASQEDKKWESLIFSPINPKKFLESNRSAWEFVSSLIIDPNKSTKRDLKKLIALVVYLATEEAMPSLLHVVEEKISQISSDPDVYDAQPKIARALLTCRGEVYLSALEAAATCDHLAVFQKYIGKISAINPGSFNQLWKRVIVNDSLGVAKYLLAYYKEASSSNCLLFNVYDDHFKVAEMIIAEIPDQLTKLNSSKQNLLDYALNQANPANPVFVRWLLSKRLLTDTLKLDKTILDLAQQEDPQSLKLMIAANQRHSLEELEDLRAAGRQRNLDLQAPKSQKQGVSGLLEREVSTLQARLQKIFCNTHESDSSALLHVMKRIKGSRGKRIAFKQELRKFIGGHPALENVQGFLNVVLSPAIANSALLSLTNAVVLAVLKEEELEDEQKAMLTFFFENSQKILNESRKQIDLLNEFVFIESESEEEPSEMLTTQYPYTKSLAQALKDYDLAIKAQDFEWAKSIVLAFPEHPHWRKLIPESQESDDLEILLIKLGVQLSTK